jgi:two-component system phosphate regulon response regulator OmpR
MTEKPFHILIVDDERRIRAMLSRYLVDEGFRVSEAGDGAATRALFESEKIDLVLLDLMMPGEDGFALARHIRQRSNVPIIMLTGKGDLIDRVAGLEAGADDYVAKPFHLREILARIRSVLRRAQSATEPPGQAPTSRLHRDEATTLSFEGWELDLRKRELRKQGAGVVPLTTGEFDLLRVFAMNPLRVLSRNQLMDIMKGHEWAAYDRAIDTQVVRIRKKIEPEPGKPTLIKTVRSAGYMFAVDVSQR